MYSDSVDIILGDKQVVELKTLPDRELMAVCFTVCNYGDNPFVHPDGKETKLFQCDLTGDVLIYVEDVPTYALVYDKHRQIVKLIRINDKGMPDYGLLVEIEKLVPGLRDASSADIFYDPEMDADEETTRAYIEEVKRMMDRAAEILDKLKDHVG